MYILIYRCMLIVCKHLRPMLPNLFKLIAVCVCVVCVCACACACVCVSNILYCAFETLLATVNRSSAHSLCIIISWFTYKGICVNEEIMIHRHWADDIFTVASSVSNAQKQMDGLLSFCKSNQTIVNELRAKVMVFGNLKEELHIKFNDTAI